MSLLTANPVIDDIRRVFTRDARTCDAVHVHRRGDRCAARRGGGREAQPYRRSYRARDRSRRQFRAGVLARADGPVAVLLAAALGWRPGRIDSVYDGMVDTHTGSLLIDSIIAGEWDVFRNAVSHIALPTSVLAFYSIAYLSRMTRSFMLEQLSQEYVTTARERLVRAARHLAACVRQYCVAAPDGDRARVQLTCSKVRC